MGRITVRGYLRQEMCHFHSSSIALGFLLFPNGLQHCSRYPADPLRPPTSDAYTTKELRLRGTALRINNTISTCFRASSRSHAKSALHSQTRSSSPNFAAAVHCAPVGPHVIAPQTCSNSLGQQPPHPCTCCCAVGDLYAPKALAAAQRGCTFPWTQHPAAVARPARRHASLCRHGSRYGSARWLSAAPGCCDCSAAVHKLPHVLWRTALMHAGSTAQQLAPLLQHVHRPGRKALVLPPPVLGAGPCCCCCCTAAVQL